MGLVVGPGGDYQAQDFCSVVSYTALYRNCWGPTKMMVLGVDRLQGMRALAMPCHTMGTSKTRSSSVTVTRATGVVQICHLRENFPEKPRWLN